jgi:hypothetical protein
MLGDKQLTVGVLAGVGHGEEERLVVAELEVLVGELVAVDGLWVSKVQKELELRQAYLATGTVVV